MRLASHQDSKIQGFTAARWQKTGLANQGILAEKPPEIFSPFAVDKPVEKQILFELPHCFLTKIYYLPKK